MQYLRLIIPLWTAHRRLQIRLQMDWLGRKLAEKLMQIMLVAFAMVAFSTGFVMGSFQMMILVYAGAVFLTTLITVPNWPFFNHHPLNWLDPSVAEKYPKPQSQEPGILKKKPAKKHKSNPMSIFFKEVTDGDAHRLAREAIEFGCNG
ncbi:unnamed protein product [Citrullus colocynthis]|uniref:Signal peptidase complex subunit 1 n=1 Tax=Citrullus colocynthis TaxID=252529 RepID=A0ABP0XTE2_9ROSI